LKETLWLANKRRIAIRIKIGPSNDLLAIAVVTALLCIVVVFVDSSVARVILGLPFLLFFPGYVIMAALFPRRSDIGGIERVALSFGLSIAVVPLVGLVLNYTPWGIKLYSILASLALLVLAMSGLAWFRRMRFPPEDRFGISFTLHPPYWGSKGVDRFLYVVLVLAIVGAIGTMSFVLVSPKEEERFTEFYILGLEGTADWYPTQFVLEGGEVVLVRYGSDGAFKDAEEGYGTVILGIVNHEEQEAVYRVDLRINGEKMKVLVDGQWVGEVGPLVLEDEASLEIEAGFAPQQVCGSSVLVVGGMPGDKILRVAGVQDFEVSDFVQIEAIDEDTYVEFAQIENVNGSDSTITLNRELKYHHSEGAAVLENHKMEFVPYMNGEPYFEADNVLHLWMFVREAS